MTYATIILSLYLAAPSSSYAANDKAQQTEDAIALQEVLANKKCGKGEPVIKEIVRTVPRMVAGRMIPTAVRKIKVVCQ